MNASVLDLRYKMRDVLRALNRRERVSILYHGKIKGEIIPSKQKNSLKSSNHPLFGMVKGEKAPPEKIIAQMRRGRYNDI